MTSMRLFLSGKQISRVGRCNLNTTAVMAQQSDPIQQLFVKKIREYADKEKTAGGKLVGGDPAAEKKLADELNRVKNVYKVAPDQVGKFPTFSFKDPQLDAIKYPSTSA